MWALCTRYPCCRRWSGWRADLYKYTLKTTLGALKGKTFTGHGTMTVAKGLVIGSVKVKANGKTFNLPMKFRIKGRTLVDLS